MTTKKKKKKKSIASSISILMMKHNFPTYRLHRHHHYRLNTLKKELILKELHQNSTVEEAVNLLRARFVYHLRLLNFHEKMKQTATDQ
jgi:hypothetical protein